MLVATFLSKSVAIVHGCCSLFLSVAETFFFLAEGSAYGGQSGHGGGSADALGYGQGGYEQGGSYEQGYGYGGDAGYEGAGSQAAYGGGQSEYGAPGYGQVSYSA